MKGGIISVGVVNISTALLSTLDLVKLEAYIPVDAYDNSATSLPMLVIGRQVASITVEKFVLADPSTITLWPKLLPFM